MLYIQALLYLVSHLNIFFFKIIENCTFPEAERALKIMI